MKRIISRVYRVLFDFTGNKSLSFVVALGYVSAINLTMIYGLSFLLKDVLPTGFILQLFAFPYFFLTCFAMVATNYVMAPTIQGANNKKVKKEDYKPVIIYTAISLLLLAYTCFGEHIF
jgi:hypothetical protein